MNMRKEDKNTKTNESESMAASKVHAVDVAERSMCVNNYVSAKSKNASMPIWESVSSTV